MKKAHLLVLCSVFIMPGCATLNSAVREGDAAEVKKMIQSGANLDAFTGPVPSDTNPLLTATSRGDAEIAKLLIEAKANVNAATYQGLTPLLATVLYHNIAEKHVEVAKMLVSAGANVNAVDSFGRTPLLAAAQNNYIRENKATQAIIDILLENKANANAQSRDGDTALSYQQSSCNAKRLKMLIDAGADVNYRKGDGSTALMEAAAKGCIENVDVLLAAKADVNIVKSSGSSHYTALTYADLQVFRNPKDSDSHKTIASKLKRAGAKSDKDIQKTMNSVAAARGKVWCVAVIMQKYDSGIGSARTFYAARFVAVTDKTNTAGSGEIAQLARQQIGQYGGNGYSEYDSIVTENDDCSQTKKMARGKYQLSDFTVDQIQKR